MCLVEHGFVSNPQERAWLTDNVARLAEAEYRAVCRSVGLTPDDQASPGADMVTGAALPLRTAGSPTANVILSLDRGAAVRRLDATEGQWALVQIPMLGLSGFVERSDVAPAHAASIGVETLLVGGPRATADQIAAALVARGNHVGNGYTDRDVENIVGYYFRAAAASQVDPLVACAQMALETDYLGSERSKRPECNPAGIGVEQHGVPGVTFNTWKAAVPAHVGRLLAYALPLNTGTTEQRTMIETALGYRPLPDHIRGVAPQLGGLTGVWASDLRYAANIARIANAMRAT